MPLDDDQISDFACRARNGDTEALDNLWRHYSEHLEYRARRLGYDEGLDWRAGYCFEELQAALGRWDGKRPLTAYAMTGMVMPLRYVNEDEYLRRRERRVVSDAVKLARSLLAHNSALRLTPEGLAQAAHCGVATAEVALEELRDRVSLQAPVGDEADGDTLAALTADESATNPLEIVARHTALDLDRCRKTLPGWLHPLYDARIGRHLAATDPEAPCDALPLSYEQTIELLDRTHPLPPRRGKPQSYTKLELRLREREIMRLLREPNEAGQDEQSREP